MKYVCRAQTGGMANGSPSACSSSGCSPEKQGQDSFPTSSTADSSEAGTIPASEEEEPSLVFLLPPSNVYKETEDPSVIARVIQRLQAEPRCLLQETVPVSIPPSGWSAPTGRQIC